MTTRTDPARACPAVNDTGLRCQKQLAPGLDIHGGGHMYGPDNLADILDNWHYDPAQLLSGQVTAIHPPERCNPDCDARHQQP